MGLTNKSTGIKAFDTGLNIIKENKTDKVIGLAGNPNVGKSTVFNALTGLNQHTGNWPGKTVTNAKGKHRYKDVDYILVDLPGTYSLMAHSVEEEIARDFVCFGDADGIIVVCDATCLERNMNLVLQTIEITDHVVVAVNLMDEAKKKHIHINTKMLEENLGVSVVPITARSNKGLKDLMEKVSLLEKEKSKVPIKVRYIKPIEDAISIVEKVIAPKLNNKLNSRFVALKLIDYDETLIKSLTEYLGINLFEDKEVIGALDQAYELLYQNNIEKENIKDKIVACLVITAEGVCADSVLYEDKQCHRKDRKLDKILTSKITGIPIMLALLLIIFWLTITGANYPSQLIANGLFWVQDRLTDFFIWANAPEWLYGVLVLGMYRTLAWVVSVMLPPMAIFFPLFTLLEDFGYLPRVAFNLDHYFKKASACGKQALTM